MFNAWFALEDESLVLAKKRLLAGSASGAVAWLFGVVTKGVALGGY